MQKYYDLNISFTLDSTIFHIVSLSYEEFQQSVPSHSHSTGSFELHYVSKGKGSLIAEDTTYPLTPNCLYVTGPLIKHAQISNSDSPLTEYGIYLNIERQTSLQAKTPSLLSPFLATPFWFGEDKGNLHLILKSLFFELEATQTGYLDIVSALLQELIILIVRHYEQSSTSTLLPTTKPARSIAHTQFLSIEKSFLYNYKEITLNKLSSLLGLSTRQTQRLLKQYYGKTFMQKKTEARMSAAVSLLANPKLSITIIADELGYSSVEHFCNAFKHYYHMSPGTYRLSL